MESGADTCIVSSQTEDDSILRFSPIDDMNESIGETLFERGCQTAYMLSRAQSTNREQGCQVETWRFKYPSTSDRIVTPTQFYRSADRLDIVRESCAIRIQRFSRGMIGRSRVRRLRKEKQELDKHEAERGLMRACSESQLDAFRVDRRCAPKTIHDLEVMFSELREWIAGETKVLRARFSTVADYKKDPKYIAGMKAILAGSIRMREKIRIKRVACMKYRPKYLITKSGVVEIENEPKRRLCEIFNLLSIEPPESRFSREKLLKTAKSEIEDPEVSALIERELVLLKKKRGFDSMPGLRLRIKHRFRELILSA